jgi:hypothetical protein
VRAGGGVTTLVLWHSCAHAHAPLSLWPVLLRLDELAHPLRRRYELKAERGLG